MITRKTVTHEQALSTIARYVSPADQCAQLLAYAMRNAELERRARELCEYIEEARPAYHGGRWQGVASRARYCAELLTEVKSWEPVSARSLNR